MTEAEFNKERILKDIERCCKEFPPKTLKLLDYKEKYEYNDFYGWPEGVH